MRLDYDKLIDLRRRIAAGISESQLRVCVEILVQMLIDEYAYAEAIASDKQDD